MKTSNYRPEVGVAVFFAIVGQKPRLITVTGISDDGKGGEQFTFVDPGNGRSGELPIDIVEFYPGVPADAKYVYCLVLEVDSGYDHSDIFEERYFFDLDAGFKYCDDIESGRVRSRCKDIDRGCSAYVRVERV